MEYEATIELMFDGKEMARIAYGALKAELLNPPSYRSKVNMVFEGSTIKIKISSSDLVGLRASINSYFKWLSAIIGALEVLRGCHRRT